MIVFFPPTQILRKQKENFDTQYLSLVFVASTKMLNKDFFQVDRAVKKLMEMIENA